MNKYDVIRLLLASGATNIQELLNAETALRVGSPIAEKRFQRALCNAMSAGVGGAELTISRQEQDEILTTFLTHAGE